MFAYSEPAVTQERKTARKEFRIRPSDDERLKRAAASVGLSESDFITEAAMIRVVEIERRSLVTMLPEDAFARFQHAIQAEGKVVPGLAKAAKRAEGLLRNA